MSRLRDERGFTLLELLVILFISGIVMSGVAKGMQVVLNQSNGTIMRTDATQRGRLVMDQLTQQLRSQVCVDTGLPSQKVSLGAATKNSVLFYVDHSNGEQSPDKRELVYDAPTKSILQKTWKATTLPGTAPTAWAAVPTTRTLLANVIPYADGSAPFLRYYGYQPTGNPRLDTLRFDPGAGSLTATQLADTARISIAMEVLPGRTPNQKISTRLEDSVHLRTSDPNKNNPDPECRA